MRHTFEDKKCFFDKIGYEPHEYQELFHKSTARFRVVAAGARGGKSMAAGAEASYFLMFPDCRIWICSSQYELAEKEMDWTIQFFSKIYWGKKRIIELCRLTSASRGSRLLSTPWGSWCKTKSAEKSQTLLGDELDVLILGEASQVKREPYERMLRARIGPRNGLLISISTPNSDSGLFVEHFENGKDKEKEDWESWQFTTLDNPFFPKEEWDVAKKELDPSVFAEQYEGRFVSRFGKVFVVERKNLIEKEQLPEKVDQYSYIFSIRPSQNNPYIVVMVAYSPDTRNYFVVDSFYKTSTSSREAATWIKEMAAGKNVVACVSDIEDYFCAELREHGVEITIPDSTGLTKENKIIRQIQVLRDFMKENRIFISRINGHVIDEIESVTWSASNEEKAKLNAEIPKDRSFGSAQCIVNSIIFVEQAMGANMYGSQ